MSALSTLVLVGPLAFAAVRSASDEALSAALTALIALLPALGVSISVAARLGHRSGLIAGVVLGVGVGWAMTAVLTLTSLRGYGLLLPPTVGLALGLLDGIGERHLDNGPTLWAWSGALGFLVSLGLILSQGWNVVFLGAVLGLVLAALLETRKDPVRGFSGGLKWPPWPLALLGVGVLGLVFNLLIAEFERQGNSITRGIGFFALAFVVLPLLAFVVGSSLAHWIRPRMLLLAELSGYLRLMWVPMGAFALGSTLLVVVAAGVYGSLGRLDPAHFTYGGALAERAPALRDWFFLAVHAALGRDDPLLRPASDVALMIASAHAVVSVGWAVVGFAAVNNYLQPRFRRLEAETSDNEERDRG